MPFPIRYTVQNDTVVVDEDMHAILNELAGRFYQLQGYVPREEFDYSTSSHPGEVLMYQMALEALYFQQCTGELE
ncbi:hypothetical protein VPHK120G1_0009 [Vibrio phage K120 g1]